jgi:prevent-host-death family protein
MTTVTIQEAQSRLTDLIRRLSPGEEVVITENDQPVARIVPTPVVAKKIARQLGTMKGSVLYMAPDFDAPLEDFKEYTG